MGTPSSSSSCSGRRGHPPRNHLRRPSRPGRRPGLGDDLGPLGRQRLDHLRPQRVERTVLSALRRVRPQRRDRGSRRGRQNVPRDRPGHATVRRRFTVHFERCELLLTPLRALDGVARRQLVPSTARTGRAVPRPGAGRQVPHAIAEALGREADVRGSGPVRGVERGDQVVLRARRGRRPMRSPILGGVAATAAVGVRTCRGRRGSCGRCRRAGRPVRG